MDALWLLCEEPVDAAGEVAPTAEEVTVLEELGDGRVRVQRSSGEKVVLTWGKDLFRDASDFPAHVPLVFANDCAVGVDLITATAVHGGLPFSEAVPHIDPEAALALHRSCPDESMLKPDEVELLESLVEAGS